MKGPLDSVGGNCTPRHPRNWNSSSRPAVGSPHRGQTESWTLRAGTPRGPWGTVENHSSPNSRLGVQSAVMKVNRLWASPSRCQVSAGVQVTAGWAGGRGV